jgi:opacity protein-like surface antigen
MFMKSLTFTPIRSLTLLTWLTSTCLLTTLSARAQDSGFYFTGGIGPAIAEDIDVKDFLGFGGGKVELDPGVGVTIAGGYNFNKFLGVEMETGFAANNIDSIAGNSPDALLYHVPFLANVVLRFDDEASRIVPYVSAGVGGDSTLLWIDDSLGVDGSDSDVVFAFQLSAGVRFRINEKMSAGLSYKYYRADEASWDVEDSGGRIKFGESTVHLIAAVFNMKF